MCVCIYIYMFIYFFTHTERLVHTHDWCFAYCRALPPCNLKYLPTRLIKSHVKTLKEGLSNTLRTPKP